MVARQILPGWYSTESKIALDVRVFFSFLYNMLHFIILVVENCLRKKQIIELDVIRITVRAEKQLTRSGTSPINTLLVQALQHDSD